MLWELPAAPASFLFVRLIPCFLGWLAPAVVPAILSLPLPSEMAAQEFEGIVRIRLISVDVDRAVGLRRISAATLFGLPTDELLQVKRRDGSPAVSASLRTYFVRGSKIRMETDDAEATYLLIDLERATLTTVDPESSSYEELSIPEITRPLFPMLRAGGYTVRELHRTRNINGIEASAYEAVAGGNMVRAWITTAYPELTRILSRLAQTVYGATDSGEARLVELAGSGTPVLVQLVDMRGQSIDDFEVQEILFVHRQPVNPSLLEIPETFQRKNPR